MDELKKAREEIDAIDQQMVSLFEKRMQAVSKVALYKKATGMKVFDSSRENVVIEKNSAYLSDEGLKPYFEDYMKDFMNVSKSYQRQLIYGKKIGYQGVKGAFSHIAAKRLFANCELNSYASFLEVIEAVEKGEIEAGVLPYENSTTGEVGEVSDLLFTHEQVFVNGFYDLPVVQNLLVVPGTKIEDIKAVYSHSQALEQSRDYLSSRGWEIIPYANTAMAARYVAEHQDKSKAAIASEETAEEYNLEILQRQINSSGVNTTRFIIVTKKKQLNGDRFGLFFTVTNEAGYLARAVKIISDTGYNMVCLRSRSVKSLPWEYYFYVEAIGDLQDPKAQQMLIELEKVTGMMRTIGAYSQIKL